MPVELIKDPVVLDVLDRLRSWLGPDAFVVVDHWEADLCAIGVASPRNVQVLVYISCLSDQPGQFWYVLEVPPVPGSDRLYEEVGHESGVSFEELAMRVAQHLARC